MDDEASPGSPEFPARPPHCLRCAHFSVSWDPDLPRSCDFFGFKCRNLPSYEVFRSTGRHCPFFRLKNGPR